MKVPHAVLNEDPLKEDFRKFLFVTWKHLGLPDPTDVQYDIARWMQKGPRRKMIMAFRGVGKSWIYAAFVCWRLYCDADYKIMVVSASKALADDFTKFVKRLINEMPILHHLRPRDGQRDTNISFDVGPAKASKDPSVKSVGITGQITGSRADEILADDIESLNNSATETGRERLAEQVKEFDAVLKPGGRISYLGTPQTVMSMYSKLPERGYTIRIWTARVPEDPEVYRGMLAPYVMKMLQEGQAPGTPVDPKRFNEADLTEREASYGRAGFQLQFMLNTQDSDALRFPLKLQDLIVMSLDLRMAPHEIVWGREEVIEGVQTSGLPGDRFYRPIFRAEKMSPYNATVMYIDPSGRGKDETAYAVVKELHGMLYLMDVGGFPGGYEDDTLKALAEKAKLYKANEILIESNFGDGMFTKLFQPWMRKVGHQCAVGERRVSGQKELRIIDTLEPVLMQHRLVVNQEVINRDFDTAESAAQSLFYQMTRVTRERGSLAHDDRLDALEGAISYFTEVLSQDTEKAAQEAAEALWEDELEEWLDASTGGTAQGRYRDNFIYKRGEPIR